MREPGLIEKVLFDEIAASEVADRKRHPKASFRRFEAWIIGAGALVVCVFIALTWF